MPVFEYKAFDSDSTSLAGTIVADTPRQARDELRQRGMAVLNVAEIAQTPTLSFRQRRLGRRNQRQVVSFVRELATLLGAGIPLLSALQTLVAQYSASMKTILQQLCDGVAAGEALADCMQRHPSHFDALCTSIVHIGEKTGSLELALKRLADFKEKSHRLRSRIATALIYPAFVTLIGMAVTMFLMTYVVPSLLHALTQAGRPLPMVTQAVKSISDFLREDGWALLAAVGGLLFLMRMFLRSEKTRFLLDRLYLHIPILGDLIRKENTSRIAIVLAALLRSGLPFIEAIQITQKTLRNRVFIQAMKQYEVAVTAGSDVAAPLGAANIFKPMVIQMLSVGQQAGNLEEMLEQLAETYDLEVATAANRLTAMLEPLLIVLLALVVGFIAFATILPILEMSNVL